MKPEKTDLHNGSRTRVTCLRMFASLSYSRDTISIGHTYGGALCQPLPQQAAPAHR